MSVVINTNFAATVAANNLAASNDSLQKSLNRLSSGSKIVTPSDDAGGLAVSMKLSSAARRQGAVNTNISNAISFLQTQDGVLKVAAKLLDRIGELATLHSDPTKSLSDVGNYETEYAQLSTELTNLASEQFNGNDLFAAGDIDVYTTENGEAGSFVTIAEADLATAIGGVADLTSVDDIKTAIENVATLRATNGAAQSVLGFASEVLTVNKANLEAANSRITDVDVAEESTQLARFNILVQSGTAMLAQANQSAQVALKLLQ